MYVRLLALRPYEAFLLGPFVPYLAVEARRPVFALVVLAVERQNKHKVVGAPVLAAVACRFRVVVALLAERQVGLERVVR